MLIGVMSDTHGALDERIFEHFATCDEIWHAGDFGSLEVVERLRAFKPLRGVYGNIDDAHIRAEMPEDLRFTCEGVPVFMTHIGGYPGRYTPRVRKILQADPPRKGLFICGHSHILKVMPDRDLDFLHINPGACGNEGWHKIKTLVRVRVEAGAIQGVEVIELGPRGALT
ncbi:MAG: metallophosphoesterase family protein [Saprospiraceae bacterium]|nr:metallophosphatase family protein [Saprospiraceae bacterium]MDW8229043.1 metallophosphoesterase family protein [Saprospiraceae bacterium]